MKRFFMMGAIILMVIISASGCTPAGEEGLTFSDPWMRPSPMQAGNGAAYVVINNSTDHDDKLVAVEGEVSETIELHMSMQTDDDVMKMQPVEYVDIPAKGQAELKPGGYHIMLIGLNEILESGSTATLTLIFEEAGAVTVEFEVRME